MYNLDQPKSQEAININPKQIYVCLTVQSDAQRCSQCFAISKITNTPMELVMEKN
jgi:hypothetical protein